MTGYLKQSSSFLQFITFLGFFFLCFAIYLVVLQAVTPSITGQSLEAIQSNAFTDPNLLGYLKITQFLYTVVVFFVPAAIFACLWQPRPAAFLGLKPAPTGIQIVIALLAMYAVLPLAGILGEWNQHFPISQHARDMEAMAEKLLKVMLNMPSPKDLLVNLILVAIVPAIGEELFFRGVLQRLIIKSTRKVWLGVFITSIIFSAVHGEMLDFLPRVALGFGLGAIYVISGNLWLSILAHVLNNGSQVVMLYLFQHGMMADDPMKDTPIAWYYVALSIPFAIGLFWALRKKSTPMPMIEPRENYKKDEVNEIGMDEKL
ncbi:MAG: CPBP family intramembrane metalloprotease [Chitinophaga sp.]|uniref:CPBP family intramembrane glutamic endopeptidase n=1 Tax=Chitinophaga sp. TaxID=1869181 RepID=UPI001B044D09|nr:CPBP family intramembrane glutamic endopeptidase [Chitinophaga sp.]MBO9728868.1 CPBP family intramembrane metalloprotease [Chitinophaga sp.]